MAVPKINSIKVYVQNRDAKHQAEYETHVLANGEFQSLIPDVDLDRLRMLDCSGVQITTNKADKPILKSVTLANIDRLLHSYGRSLLETSQETTMLIFYSVQLDVAYCTNPHLPGEVYQNGYHARKATGGDNDYKWHGTTNNGRGQQRFAVGLSARVIEKTTHRLADGRFFVEHSTAKFPEGTFAHALNEFCVGTVPDKNYWSATDPETPRVPPGKNYEGSFLISEGLHYVPYTEEAAEFFHNMMLNLAKLAERMRLFFGDGGTTFLENLNDPNKLKLLGAK